MPRTKEMDTRKIVSVPIELAEAIADFRFGERIGTEAEAIRRLIEAGLHAKGVSVKPSTRKASSAEE